MQSRPIVARKALLLLGLGLGACSNSSITAPLTVGTSSTPAVPRAAAAAAPTATVQTASGDAVPAATPGPHVFVSEGALFELIALDLQGSFQEPDRAYIRYLSAMHLANAGAAPAVLATVHAGVAELMNGLSSTPTAKDAKQLGTDTPVYRIDLRDYGWDAARWEELIAAYPYLIVPQDQKGLAFLQTETKTSVPVVRADWFLYTASRAPLYYRLGLQPDTLTGLTTQLGLNLAADIAANKVMRAGFNNSQDEGTNRVIERHGLPTGAFWRSYEFASNIGTRDILTNPLGPATAVGAVPTFTRPVFAPQFSVQQHAFTEDGGEIIYTLPNGMLAFFVIQADGQRLDRVPPIPNVAPVVPGFSCMNCHGKGFITKPDMVRAAAAANPELASSMPLIQALYPDTATFSAQVTQDTAALTKILSQVGVTTDLTAAAYQGGQAFSQPLAPAEAAAELGVSLATLQKALGDEASPSDVAAALAAGKVDRDVFEAAFGALATLLKPE